MITAKSGFSGSSGGRPRVIRHWRFPSIEWTGQSPFLLTFSLWYWR